MIDMAALKHSLPREEAIRTAVGRGMTPEQAEAAYDELPPRTDGEGRSITLQPFSEIQSKRTDWLWEGRIPRGMISLLVGDEGLGKSALLLGISAKLTHGTLEGDYYGDPSNVALLTTEDDPARTMRPRLEAAGADMDRVFMIKLKRNGQDSGICFPQDAGALGRALGEANVRLAGIDPMAATLDPKVNTWKDTDVRGALTPLIAAAEEHDFAVLGALHTNKRSNASAREKAMGSAGFQQLPRSALLLGQDPDDQDRRVLAHFKCNVGKRQPSLSMTLEQRTVNVEGKPYEYPVAVLGGESMFSADDIARGLSDSSEVDKALNWLYGYLSDGDKPAAQVQQDARDTDHKWRTVERAKTRSNGDIRSEQRSDGWWWKLTEGAAGFPVS